MLVRALAYILARSGATASDAMAEDAVLNANYIRKRLEPYYDLPYTGPEPCTRSSSATTGRQLGVQNVDIAKRLIDYGFHPPTMSFPLIVHGAMMIEPTETEGIDELDAFVDAMIAIAREAEENPDLVKGAPYRHAGAAPRRGARGAPAGAALAGAGGREAARLGAGGMVAWKDGGLLQRLRCSSTIGTSSCGGTSAPVRRAATGRTCQRSGLRERVKSTARSRASSTTRA